MKRGGIALALLALGACASHTGVVPTGRDSFMIARQAATGFAGLGNLKAELIAEAGAHCKALGRELQLTATNESQPPYVLGNYPRAELGFMCLRADDPAFQRPRLVPTPDAVIEIRK
jgi:hypothetical protein